MVTVGNEDFDLPDRPGTAPLRIDRDGLALEIVDDDIGTRPAPRGPSSTAGRAGSMSSWPNRRGADLNVVIPWSDQRFNYTSKHQARPATGTLSVGTRTREFGGSAGDAWGVLDVGRGRWPAEIAWNWGGGAGRCADHVVGLQFGAKWTAGSGFTENGLIVDGRLSKIGRELEWDYDWEQPMLPWRVTDPGGQLGVTLAPRFDKHTQLPGRDKGSETHQVFGTWSGRLRTDEGLELELDAIEGFAEEARQEW